MSGGPDQGDPFGADDSLAPPRANGELVFTAPWQSRLFGTAMHLRHTGLLDWEAFRQDLIVEIGRHQDTLDATPSAEPGDFDYWGCWQRALEHRLGMIGLVEADELDRRATKLADRAPGHDHSHSHDHDHSHDHQH